MTVAERISKELATGKSPFDTGINETSEEKLAGGNLHMITSQYGDDRMIVTATVFVDMHLGCTHSLVNVTFPEMLNQNANELFDHSETRELVKDLAISEYKELARKLFIRYI